MAIETRTATPAQCAALSHNYKAAVMAIETLSSHRRDHGRDGHNYKAAVMAIETGGNVGDCWPEQVTTTKPL